MLAQQAGDRALVAAQVFVHGAQAHPGAIHPIAHQRLDALGGKHGRIAAIRCKAVHGALNIVLGYAQRLAERAPLDHGTCHACAAHHGNAAAHLETGLHKDRVGGGVIHHGEHAQGDLSAFGATDHGLHVVAFRFAAIGEVGDDGQQGLRIAAYSVVQIGLVHILGSDKSAFLGLDINISRTVIFFVDFDFVHVASPFFMHRH